MPHDVILPNNFLVVKLRLWIHGNNITDTVYSLVFYVTGPMMPRCHYWRCYFDHLAKVCLPVFSTLQLIFVFVINAHIVGIL